MDAAPRPALALGRVAEAALATAVGALLAWAVFAGGGSGDDGLARVGIPAIVCAALGLALGARGALALPRLDRASVVAVAAATGLTCWVGASIAWSIAGDRSWEWLDRGLVYLAFLALGLLAGAARRGAVRVCALVAAVTAAAIGWALLGVAIPALFEDGDRIARLREPVGYWNGLAVLADAALAFGLWVARGPGAGRRIGGALLFYAATIALLLTQSRAGIVGAVAVVGLWLFLSDDRLADALRTTSFGTPGLLVAGWAFTRPALVEDGVLRADRVADGRWFAVLALAGGLIVAVLALRVPVERLVAERSRRVRSIVLQACGLAAVAAVLGLVAAVGNPFSWASSQLSGGECGTSPVGSPTSARTTGSRGGGKLSTSQWIVRWRIGRWDLRARPARLSGRRDSR